MFPFQTFSGKRKCEYYGNTKESSRTSWGGGRKNSSIIQSISSSWRHKIHSTDATKESNKSSQTTMASTLDTYEGKLLNLTTTIHHDLYCTKRIKSKALRLLTAGCEAVMDAVTNRTNFLVLWLKSIIIGWRIRARSLCKWKYHFKLILTTASLSGG